MMKNVEFTLLFDVVMHFCLDLPPTTTTMSISLMNFHFFLTLRTVYSLLFAAAPLREVGRTVKAFNSNWHGTFVHEINRASFANGIQYSISSLSSSTRFFFTSLQTCARRMLLLASCKCLMTTTTKSHVKIFLQHISRTCCKRWIIMKPRAKAKNEV